MNTVVVLTIGDEGEVFIPQDICDAEGWRPGVKLVMVPVEYGWRLCTREQLRDEIWANLKHPDVNVVDELIADRRAEAARDLEELGGVRA
ncbi:MAG: hypothetical protein LBI33_00490 [Propionibacteriaceae bacterium]|jgi:hypothetical protein|nr:hypothetical protein [Propionibacteriaceae bacterium]